MVDIGARSLQTLGRIPGQLHQTYDPYVQQGQTAGGVIGPQFGQMASDPVSHLNKLMAGYQPSEGYQTKQQELMRQLRGTAQAGGIAGTPQHQAGAGELTRSLMSQDMQEFLRNVRGIESEGLGGEQRLYDIGYGASGQLGRGLESGLKSQASLEFQQDRQQATDEARKNKEFWDTILGIGGGALGFATGGPMGAMQGASAFSGGHSMGGSPQFL